MGTGGGGCLIPLSPPSTLSHPVGSSHLQAHVVREAGEEVMLHVAADERVAEGPVEEGVAGQVEDTQAHEVDPLGFAVGREHGEADVLRERQGGHPVAPVTSLVSSQQSQWQLCLCVGMKSHILGSLSWVCP